MEDSPAGIRAAKAAGMIAVAVGGTHNAEQLEEADAFVTTLEHVQIRVGVRTAVGSDSPSHATRSTSTTETRPIMGDLLSDRALTRF
jgi:hypothetical protein